MSRIFLKQYKTKDLKYSFKYWFAVIIEIIAIILWCIGLYELVINKCINPAGILIHSGGILFTTGSFIYAKLVS